jgi:hypothetical protein
MPHLVLLGDSSLDNAAYTGGGPDVITQVRAVLPAGWSASLAAVDGATTRDVEAQLSRLPAQATHLVLSVGGNDALLDASVLDVAASTAAEALLRLADVVAAFELRYRGAVAACLRSGRPLTVCTIYNGCFPDPQYQRVVTTALTVFNDAIVRVASERGLAVIDLRAVCALPEDYANPIEPSSAGGEKIARVIAAHLTGPRDSARASRIITA